MPLRASENLLEIFARYEGFIGRASSAYFELIFCQKGKPKLGDFSWMKSYRRQSEDKL
jgi:hypothetical protein